MSFCLLCMFTLTGVCQVSEKALWNMSVCYLACIASTRLSTQTNVVESAQDKQLKTMNNVTRPVITHRRKNTVFCCMTSTKRGVWHDSCVLSCQHRCKVRAFEASSEQRFLTECKLNFGRVAQYLKLRIISWYALAHNWANILYHYWTNSVTEHMRFPSGNRL
mgnify:CR=1 FL=1